MALDTKIKDRRKKDYSREIYEKYYKAKRVLEITLNDGTVLEGIFISFVPGDEGLGQPLVLKWHFLAENEIEKHKLAVSIDPGEDYGRLINQEDIKNVKFKQE